ncbi:BT_3987 domain-containing protein [Proteiniphilum acetatigenes]|uniref:BT_3987 domain-containing protein n=1 Tax=Proteiniphilum acetatigenes TaxID=294710 RepID=UPI0003A89A0C|nr:DUF1735 domain-containing protein [Proteiniphilum acetatigenes]
MKKYSIITSLIVFILASCDLEELHIEDSGQYSKIFMQSAISGSIEKNFIIEDKWHGLSIGAGYGGVDQLDGDLSVTFEIRPDLVAEFNAANGTRHAILPEESYRFDVNTVTIPAGKSGSNSIEIEVNPFYFGGTRTFLLPVSIKEVNQDITVNPELKTTYFVISGSYGENPYEIHSQSKWSVVEVSSDVSDGAGGGLGLHAIDDNLDTYWHSNYRRDADGWRPQHPHHIVVDMDEELLLHGFRIHGRPASNHAYLFPNIVSFQTSMDGENWTDVGIFTGIVASADASATIYFEESVEARFFKLTVIRSATGGDTTAITEIKCF